MGMGEALANPHVFDALTLLTDQAYAGMSARRITVSTVGFAPNLERLVNEHPQVTITLSVHSPFPNQRKQIIPLEERFPLARNLNILDRHAATSRRKVYLAYLLIAGVNDSDDHLAALAKLIHEAAGAVPEYRAPSSNRVDEFVRGLTARGIHATRRRQFGTGIDAACGQLHAKYLTQPSPGAALINTELIPVTPVGG